MSTLSPRLFTYKLSAFLGVLLGGLTALLSLKALILLLGGIAFALMLIFPHAAYYSLIASVPVQMELIPGVSVAKLLIPLIVLLTAFNFISHRVTFTVRVGWPLIAGGIFFAIAILSLGYAGDVSQALKDVNQLLTYIVFFFFTAIYVRTLADFERVFRILVVVGFLEAVITTVQVMFELQFGGDWKTSGSADLEFGNQGFRADGTSAHPIFLAAFFQVVIPITIAYIIIEKRLLMRLLLAGATLLMLYAWWKTYSRSSVIAAGVMLLTFVYTTSRAGRYCVTTFVTLSLIVLTLYGFNLEDLMEDFIATLEDLSFIASINEGVDLNPGLDSLRFRLESSIGGWYLFLDNPLLGVGLGQAVLEYMPYLPHWTTSASHPAQIHNLFVEAAAELGIAVFIAFVALWVYAFSVLGKLSRHPAFRFYGRTLTIVLAGLLALGLMTPMLREVWLVLGFIITLDTIYRERPNLSPE